MRILKSTRGISGNRMTKIDPNKNSGTSSTEQHTHPNLSLLNNLSIQNKYLKVADDPVETHLIAEEW